EHDVGYQIAEQGQDGDEQRDAQYRRHVQVRSGSDDLNSQSAVIKDALDHHGAAQEPRKIEPQDDHDGAEGIANRVTNEHPAVAAALGFGRAYVVLDQNLEDGAAHEAAEKSDAQKGEGQHG